MTVHDTSAAVFERLLGFLYTDQLQPEDLDEALELISAAHFYGLEGMRPACEAFFGRANNDVITPDNVVDVRCMRQTFL